MWFLFLSSSMIGLYSIYTFYTNYLFPPALKTFDDISDEDEDYEVEDSDEETEDLSKLYKFICYRVIFEDNSELLFDKITEEEMKELYKVNDDPRYNKPKDWVDDEMIRNPAYNEQKEINKKLKRLKKDIKKNQSDDVSMRRESLVELDEPLIEEDNEDEEDSEVEEDEPEMIPNPDYIGEWVEPEHEGLMVKFIILEYMYKKQLMKQIIKNRELTFPIYNFPIRKTEFEYYPEQMFLEGVDITNYVKPYLGPAINFYMDTFHDHYLKDILYDHPLFKDKDFSKLQDPLWILTCPTQFSNRKLLRKDINKKLIFKRHAAVDPRLFQNLGFFNNEFGQVCTKEGDKLIPLVPY